MTIDTFFNNTNGRFIDYDGMYSFQCVDLIRQYLEEVLNVVGYTLPPVTYAKQLFTNFPNAGTSKFTKVFNKPTNAPKKGDIVIWGYYPFVTGWAGHVAICSGASMMNFISFDQNYPKGSFCKFVNHSYKGVLGWLSPK